MSITYTQEQQAIINHQGKHAIVSAVAGSGKTQTMLARVIKLIDDGVSARKILVVMFNKDAQTAFTQRLKDITGNQALPSVRTFHAMAFNMLKRLQALNLVDNFPLQTNQFVFQKLSRQVLDEHEKDDSAEELNTLADIITQVKAAFMGDAHYQGDQTCHEMDLFKTFERLRLEAKIRFFDDLQYDLIKALRENRDLCQLFQNRLEHIIVDEYQDVNPCQQEIIKLLAGDSAKVMVVGDINQCIYEFRGSDPNIMLHGFREDFKESQQYTLSQTFRFGQKLSNAANELIAHNKLRFNAKMQSHESAYDTQIHLVAHKSYNPSEIINKALQCTDSFKNIAVLVREFSHAASTEIALLNHEIPYSMMGGRGFFETDVVRSMLGFLRLADNAQNLTAMTLEGRAEIIQAMVKCPSLYLPPTQVKAITQRLIHEPSGIEVLNEFAANQPKASKSRILEERADIWDYALSIDLNDSAYLILKDLYYQLGYKRYFEFALTRKEDQERKISLAQSLLDFIKELGKNVGDSITYIDRIVQNAKLIDTTDKVVITSIHKAKGLEFDCVIMPELIKDKFPSERTDNIESERRIYYVGLTRAKKQLYLVGSDDTDKVMKSWQSSSKKLPKAYTSSAFIYEGKVK